MFQIWLNVMSVGTMAVTVCNWWEMNNIWKCGWFVHAPGCFVSGLYNYELLRPKSAYFRIKTTTSLFHWGLYLLVCFYVSARFVYIFYTASNRFFLLLSAWFHRASVGYLAVALSPFAICEVLKGSLCSRHKDDRQGKCFNTKPQEPFLSLPLSLSELVR